MPVYIDDLNRRITLSGPARRIIALSPAVTENLFAIGAGNTVVACTSADTYPSQVARIPRVGDFGTPRYEMIRALKPDLLIAESGTLSAGEIERIADRAKVPVFAQLSRTYDDVARHLGQLGSITGHVSEAGHSINELLHVANVVKRQVAGQKPVTAFIEVSHSPLYAAGPGSFLDDLLKRAGGINVVRTREPYPQYSREALLAANPQVYIVTIPGATERIKKTDRLPPPFDQLTAAKTGRIFALPSDLLFRPTPRLAKGLVLLVQALHGR